ncbi:MAG: ATP synthase F1 subunit epsilon [Candidatus Kapaibacteriales bacterium]
METEKLLDLEVLTPQAPIFKGKVISATVPGSKAPFQILYNHAPIVSGLDPGIVEIKDENGNLIHFATSSGFITVTKNSISIFVDSAKSKSEIEVEKVKAELAELRQALKQTKNDFEINKLRSKIAELETELALTYLEK